MSRGPSGPGGPCGASLRERQKGEAESTEPSAGRGWSHGSPGCLEPF